MIKTKNQEKNKFFSDIIFILIFFAFFFNSNLAIAKVENCEIIEDKLKKKNCIINNKAEKLKNKIKEKSSGIKDKISSDTRSVLEKHEKFQKESPKTLWKLLKKIQN